uniref:phenylalanine--tRNA ligase n=1 Tax=Gracilaria vermiculophylla TaxID=2608709 RepID=A0A8F7GPX3_9FLOR|nr:phenylalanine-tRNA ligase beta subunit [Gracilaria vermiculophylla]WDZ67882.1 phenylalanine-tRNA ligase beta subunit [Gracilaria vermiculophylla]
MRFSLRWLQQIVDLRGVKFTTLVDKLNISGFEVDNIVRNPNTNDILFDLTTTANRQDVLTVVGLSREISSLFNRTLLYKFYKASVGMSVNSLNLSSSISLSDLSLVHMKYLHNNSSPLWLQYYLSNQNIKPLNLLMDIPQYIYLKWGQSIEVFDKNKITSLPLQYSLFNLTKDRDTELHSRHIKLEVLKYDDLIMSTIGFNINHDLQCDQLTNSIIILGQIFNKQYIKNIQIESNLSRDLSRKILNQGLRSDFMNAFYESVQLLGSFGLATLGKFYGYHEFYSTGSVIFLEKNRIHNILGYIGNGLYRYLTVEQIIKLLNNLNFFTTYDNVKCCFRIKVPIHRQNDITRPIDVIEEIGRIYGFNNFISKLPLNTYYSESILFKNIFTSRIYKIRYLLRFLGLNEVQNDSFLDYSIFYQNMNYQTRELEICNPLVQDQSRLRSNLLTKLISNQQYNLRQGNNNIEVFEIGKVFKSNLLDLEDLNITSQLEFLCLSGLISNFVFLRQSWSHKQQSLSWFHAKGIVEEFLDRLQVPVTWKKVTKLKRSKLFINLMNILDINQTAIIYNKCNQEIGIFGKLSKNYNNCTYVFEFDLMRLISSIRSFNHINSIIASYSNYPSLTRDISLTVQKSSSIDLIRETILNSNNNLIESIEVFNQYKHKSTNSFYSVGLRIVYRAYDRTLNSDDIKSIDIQIEKLLNQYKMH